MRAFNTLAALNHVSPMCLRLNKDGKVDEGVSEQRKLAQMREPAGYLGDIVRRLKYRAANRGNSGASAHAPDPVRWRDAEGR